MMSAVEPEIRLIVMEILQLLVDRRRYADKLRKIKSKKTKNKSKRYFHRFSLDFPKIFLNWIYQLKVNRVVYSTSLL